MFLTLIPIKFGCPYFKSLGDLWGDAPAQPHQISEHLRILSKAQITGCRGRSNVYINSVWRIVVWLPVGSSLGAFYSHHSDLKCSSFISIGYKFLALRLTLLLLVIYLTYFPLHFIVAKQFFFSLMQLFFFFLDKYTKQGMW